MEEVEEGEEEQGQEEEEEEEDCDNAASVLSWTMEPRAAQLLSNLQHTRAHRLRLGLRLRFYQVCTFYFPRSLI